MYLPSLCKKRRKLLRNISPLVHSLVCVSFFFTEKRHRPRPCVDYRGLNAVTVKYSHPLPYIPPAIEQLHGASIYTKLNLWIAYNLVHIRAGDEWKTAFSTSSGNYHYSVMPYDLANALSCFQAFVSDMFHEWLNKFVIIYLDDVLIYWERDHMSISGGW